MKTILKMAELGLKVLGACTIAAVFWLVLAAPGLLSERDTVIHAVALTQTATR